MSKFLLISGVKGSGKGLIRGLLDGHPDLFVSPFHEVVLEAFYKNKINVEKKMDIEKIRNILATNGRYFQIERFIKEKENAQSILIGGNDRRETNINLDYELFDRSWVKNLFKKGKKWNSQQICEEIYKSFSANLLSPYLKNSAKKKYYCSLSTGYQYAVSGFINTFPNSKIIYLKRDPLEIISAIIKRKRNKKDSRSDTFSRQSLLDKYGNKEFINSIYRLNKEADKLSKKNPNKILIINFLDFFKNQASEIKRILKFLQIRDHYSLKYYSSGGYKITHSDGSSLLSSPVDKGYDNLTKKELKKLKLFIKN